MLALYIEYKITSFINNDSYRIIYSDQLFLLLKKPINAFELNIRVHIHTKYVQLDM